ncbi:MAG: hypothetical protein V1875_04420 [Candidatus Altiarchaeota archaeon]
MQASKSPMQAFSDGAPAIAEILEFGAGRCDLLERKARRFPSKLYIAVDPAYGRAGGSVSASRVKELAGAGVSVAPSRMGEYIGELLKTGVKTKRILLDVPLVGEGGMSEAEFRGLFKNANSLLADKGRIEIASYNWKTLFRLWDMAEDMGLAGEMGRYPDWDPKWLRCEDLRTYAKLTYEMKRRKWEGGSPMNPFLEYAMGDAEKIQPQKTRGRPPKPTASCIYLLELRRKPAKNQKTGN